MSLDPQEQVLDIAYGADNLRIPTQAQNAAYANALRSLYARHGVALFPHVDRVLRLHAEEGEQVAATTHAALHAGITPLEIIAVARLAYSEGKS